MENKIKDGLNFVIGASQALKEEVETGFPKLQSTFQELAAKGAEDKSEVSVSIRKYAQEGINYIQSVISSK